MRKIRKLITVIYFQIGVNVIGIPEIIKHYKNIEGYAFSQNVSKYHR